MQPEIVKLILEKIEDFNEDNSHESADYSQKNVGADFPDADQCVFGTVKAEKSPVIKREVRVAITEATMMGLKAKTPNSPKMTSTAKRAPAMGALNVAPIPAPAPAATRVRMPLSLTRNICPMVEAKLELI